MEIERKDYFAQATLFMEALHVACEGKDADTVQGFPCPICKGEAKALRSAYNGHHRGMCEQCGMSMIE